MDSLPTNKFIATAFLAGTLLLYIAVSRRRSKVYPPGPPPDPLIGHARIFPSDCLHNVFAEWGRKYGDIISVHVLGKPIVIINSLDVARDLLEKRGAKYSDRPSSVLYDMMNWSRAIFLLPVGDRWRMQRRMFGERLSPTAVKAFFPIIDTEVNGFLRRFEVDPLGYKSNLHRLLSSMTLNLIYGYKVTTDDDHYVAGIERAAYLTSKYLAGTVPVDLLPILRFLPEWFPGAAFVSHARETDTVVQNLCDELYLYTKKSRDDGTAGPSLVSHWQDDYENSRLHGLLFDDLKVIGFASYVAGVGTTESTLLTFFLMMVNYPNCARIAQNDIDTFVSEEGRLPTLQDRNRLPYIDFILKETYRVCSPAPLSLPHTCQTDDDYKGMFIPGGSLVLPNIWNMMNDEKEYPSPASFDPERFRPREGEAKSSTLDPTDVVFGFGRRICPGRLFADSALWMTIASVLAVYDILPPLDPETGKEYMPKIEFISSVTIHPKPFDCRVLPRSEKHMALLHD